MPVNETIVMFQNLLVRMGQNYMFERDGLGTDNVESLLCEFHNA